jgi:hypothetical protein
VVSHEIFALVMLGVAAVSGVNVVWALLKFVIYQISFAIGRGFRDGKSGSSGSQTA